MKDPEPKKEEAKEEHAEQLNMDELIYVYEHESDEEDA